MNDESLKIFVKCNFPEIQSLNFKGNNSSDKLLEIMVMQKWNKLKKVDLSFNIYHDVNFGNRISKFTFLYPFITDGINKKKG